MTWFACVHGGFEGPEGWAELPRLGLAEELPDPEAPAAPAPRFQRTLVLTGDTLPEGQSVAAYVQIQQHLLAGLLTDFVLLATLAPAAPGHPWLLHYQMHTASGMPLVQRQGYFVRDRSVVILTQTVQHDTHQDAADFAAAIESFVFSG